MENINKTLKKLGGNENFQKRYQQKRREIINNPYVRAFLAEHSHEITNEMIEKGLTKLYEYSTQSKDCQNCSSLDGCENLIKGYYPELVIRANSIDIQYDRCPQQIMYDEKRKNEKLIKSMHFPKDLLHVTFENIDIRENTPGREEALDKATSFVANYTASIKQKGLYFYGQFGVGKSFLLGAIANELAAKKVPSMIVYVPELLRELKNSIANSTLNEKIETLKKQQVLMLDDLGAESMSSWTRDEVLGPILQYRMQENLPTFFTSNFDFQELEHHLTYSQRGEEEKMKARRIMERIKYLADSVPIDGPNRRI
ncbi:primosomal protein DnaI [Bacillus sp. 1NLA3E]|uniref:primosomal protein DnaI n=1 Tax=Bacillus sp. 1NLA3E TaxID=666686 RepID=UPI000247E920|nr:primosomal protein DnaI [Bacillus sp. 1NLA3E]AGK55163.1 primosomal protein DnaI [Bacillus sp. 1NLA3E]